MRNFLLNDENNNLYNGREEINIENNANSNLFNDILSSDNTEILLFLIIFLLLFTSFGKR